MLGVTILFAVAFLTLVFVLIHVLRHGERDHLAFSPLAVCLFIEALLVWPAACYAYYIGLTYDLYAYFVVISCTTALVGGYVLFPSLFPNRRVSVAAFLRRRMIVPETLSPHFGAIVVCAGVLSLVGFYYFGGVPSVIHVMGALIREGFHSGVAELAGEARLAATKDHYFSGVYRGQGAINVLMQTGWPILSSLALLGYLHTRRANWCALTGAMLFLSFIFVAGNGTRAPFLWLLITILVVLSLQVRLNVRKCILAGCLLFAVLFGLSMVKKFASIADSDHLFRDGTAALAERIFLGNGTNSILVVELVRDGMLQFQYGDVHATKLMNALPFAPDRLPLAYEIFVLVDRNARDRTTFYTMTTLGEAYADFGWLGSLVLFLLFGIAFAAANQYLFRREKTLVNTVIAGVTSLNLGLVTMNGPVRFLAWLAVFCIFMCFYRMIVSVFANQRLPSVRSPVASAHGSSMRRPQSLFPL